MMYIDFMFYEYAEFEFKINFVIGCEVSLLWDDKGNIVFLGLQKLWWGDEKRRGDKVENIIRTHHVYQFHGFRIR